MEKSSDTKEGTGLGDLGDLDLSSDLGLNLDQLLTLPRWAQFYSLKTGGGYKDNVLLSDFNPQESAFLNTGVEVFLSRLPEDGKHADFILSYDDIRFLAPVEQDKEQLLFTQWDLRQDLPREAQARLRAEYVYQNQVLDVSVTDANLDIVPVKGHGLGVMPGFRMGQWGPWWSEVELTLRRQFFAEPLDDYWEFGPQWLVGINYGHQSEWSLGYEFNHLDYDRFEALTETGDPITGTTRVFQQQLVEMRWRHYWDAARHWRATVKLSWKRNRDNGGGYLDFDRYVGTAGMRYRRGDWEFSGELRGARYDYDVQPANPGEAAKRERTELGVFLRGEWKLFRFLRLYTEYEREVVHSNSQGEDYTLNLVKGGLLWEY